MSFGDLVANEVRSPCRLTIADDIAASAVRHSSRRFHLALLKGASPQRAAEIILRGVRRGGRIVNSDGRAHDLLARFLPTANVRVVRLIRRLHGIAPR